MKKKKRREQKRAGEREGTRAPRFHRREGELGVMPSRVSRSCTLFPSVNS